MLVLLLVGPAGAVGGLGTFSPAVSLVVLGHSLVVEPPLLRVVLHNSNQRALSVSAVWVRCLNV